jgi:chromosome segregation ATPase
MINDAVLKALQSRMRKLTVASISSAARAEQLRVAIEEAQAAVRSASDEEAEAQRESDKLLGDVKAVNNYVEELIRNGEGQALIAALKEELSELENQQREAVERIERLKSRSQALKLSLENNIAELQSTEQKHRQTSDQAMKLREHIEKVAHSESEAPRKRG